MANAFNNLTAQEICAQRNKKMQEIVRRAVIDNDAAYNNNFPTEIITKISKECKSVLDFGKSSRGAFSLFSPEQIKTADIIKYSDYPDVFIDICDSSTFPDEQFDAIVCLAILEHVYNPQAAVDNMFNAVRAGGTVFCYVPFLYRYHAPDNLHYQDYFRFTRDGLAYLFRDYSSVTLYPVRGRLSTVANLLGAWKNYVERLFGSRINRWIDTLSGNRANTLQASGYYIIARR